MAIFNNPQSRQLYQMTWPMLIGMLAIASNQLIDSAFIGQLGSQPLAVVGFSMPIYQVIIGIQVGLGIATTSLISRALGAQQEHYAQQLGCLIIITGFLLMTLLCLLLWHIQQPIAINLGADKSLLPLLRAYWMPWLLSCWLGAMLYFGFSILRARGDTRLPATALVFSSLMNIALDPLFIFVFDLGLAGAAWATVSAFTGGCLIIYKPIIKRQLIRLPSTINMIVTALRRLFSFMTPALLSQFIPPLSALLATALVATFGNEAVATWGLGNRIEFFSIILVLSLTMSMPAMIGCLMGENNLTGIDQLIRIAIRFIILSQVIIALITALLSVAISSALTTDATIAQQFNQYLLLVPISYSGLGISMLLVSACCAMGMPGLALIMSALRLLVCYLPLLWLGAESGGLIGLFIGAAAGNFCAGYMSWLVYQNHLKHLHAQQQSHSGYQSMLNIQRCPEGSEV
ncbi:MATE family efflux transporter [Amphritea sp. 1_MG-2023]|uniref:MATE family efflux transporter n=1 Tax=Amphritea sp. 1_MG-2023 TaxID=3062670 RepID=UPI0026E44B6D|nr:MATE family efflux transporter [Amphritea sp. 1_MG-2023]MDO6565249.1 MATE family efflux transporter [Amphritea sp. 1_MG-2023]